MILSIQLAETTNLAAPSPTRCEQFNFQLKCLSQLASLFLLPLFLNIVSFVVVVDDSFQFVIDGTHNDLMSQGTQMNIVGH